MYKLADFSYQLPPDLIAHAPSSQRDHCRLLVFRRATGTWSHHYFYELPQILQELAVDLVLVRNNSRVIPARIWGQKTTGGRVEVLLTRQLASDAHQQTWSVISRPGLKTGQSLTFPPSSLTAVCRSADTGYERTLAFQATFREFTQFLQEYGQTPIPPYIHSPASERQLRVDYQTVYASVPGSVAAPTAGLHFTPELTQILQEKGVEFIDVTLHVGLGTFLTVKTDDIRQHHMHTEYYSIDETNLARLRAARRRGAHLLAIGTTATRTLESVADQLDSPATNLSGDTNIFLYPPARFRLTDHLLTNFHLSESTLLMLVSAFASAPPSYHHFHDFASSPLGHAYQDAIANRYRFFSFGDAMLII